MKLNKRQEELLRQVVKEGELILPNYSKSLRLLHGAGFVFVRDSDNACFGDKSVTVIPSYDGEDFLDELDKQNNTKKK